MAKLHPALFFLVMALLIGCKGQKSTQSTQLAAYQDYAKDLCPLLDQVQSLMTKEELQQFSPEMVNDMSEEKSQKLIRIAKGSQQLRDQYKELDFESKQGQKIMMEAIEKECPERLNYYLKLTQ